ncbi:MAG: LysM peptidoglycan-binding domain-containing protein [Flammeovirgaceae bacterium]|nr:MAG: LysM peptidoglycan-binding domain-containing protein [Flammeovirgaceae bacterium]
MIRLTALLLVPVLSTAQSPQVPHKMQVAGITLSIRDDARREIQKDVDALTQYPKYFDVKVERAKTYFPIIEQIFKDERVPDDFKYLVLQESALIADAVSVSNAVGFWQFKDFTATEMGLRVDNEVDERMNIVSSTRAAARYLKKNNYYFNNWLYALQAYQMGAGAVQRTYTDYESGARHMEITSNTYWYVKKFLAHKVAFEGAVTGMPEVKLLTFTNHKRKTLSDIAREIDVSEEKLAEYNKWIRKTHIPDDRKYAVMIPVEGKEKTVYAAVAKNNEALQQSLGGSPGKVEARSGYATANDVKIINGIPAIRAEAGENAAAVAKRAAIGLSAFLKFNDLSISDPLTAGAYYYTRKKNTQGAVAQHVTGKDETLWSISQQYGVQLRRVKKFNPGVSQSRLPEGMVVNLISNSTAHQPTNAEQVVELNTEETFSWVTPATDRVEVPVVESLVENQAVPVLQEPEWPTVNNEAVTPQFSHQHVVAAGETLYGIAKKYNIGVMDLAGWNNLNLEQGIKPGQVLSIRKPEENSIPAEGFIIYEVKSTDTLYSVARQHGVTIKQLMDWNGKTDFTLSAGEKLKIQRHPR